MCRGPCDVRGWSAGDAQGSVTEHPLCVSSGRHVLPLEPGGDLARPGRKPGRSSRRTVITPQRPETQEKRGDDRVVGSGYRDGFDRLRQ